MMALLMSGLGHPRQFDDVCHMTVTRSNRAGLLEKHVPGVPELWRAILLNDADDEGSCGKGFG
jgi:hypothetical protein